MNDISVEPVGNKIYFANKAVEVVNTDGSGRTTLLLIREPMTYCLIFDLKNR